MLLAAALLGPSAALAASGPSAGDNQYTDPLKSTTTTASKPTKTATPTTAPATTPPPSTSSGTINTAPPVATATATATTTTPTATTATSATSTAATLPRTGYDGWLAAALGAGFVAAGFGVRRRVASR